MKNNRLFGILYLLLTNNTITAKELATYFEVSTRTIYRDIEVLCELNIPIYMNKGKNGGIKLLEHYKFDKALLTDKEQNQILFSLQGINKLQADTSATYHKLKAIFDKQEENWFDVDFSVWSNSDEHKQNFEKIKNAIINKNVITFTYFSSYGITSNRKVEPFKLQFKYNAWYLWSFDQNKNEERIFKIMRMKDIKVLEETFERKLMTRKKRDEYAPQMVNLQLQINAKLSYRVYDEFDESSIQKLENGDFLISTSLPLNDWVYGYLLSFGADIKVLKPIEIQKEIRKILQESLKNYL